MGAVELAGALTDPQEVAGGVVGQLGARVDAGQRALVVQQQGLVGGEELGALERLEVRAAGGHELHGAVDLAGQLLVGGVRRVGREALVPRVHLAQVGEAALREGADQVQRGRGGVVGLHHAARVVGAGFRGEVVAVDDVAAEGRQRHAVAGLVVGGARLGELAGHAAHLDDRHGGAVGQHDGHLQDGAHAGARSCRRWRRRRSPRSRRPGAGTPCPVPRRPGARAARRPRRRRPAEGGSRVHEWTRHSAGCRSRSAAGRPAGCAKYPVLGRLRGPPANGLAMRNSKIAESPSKRKPPRPPRGYPTRNPKHRAVHSAPATRSAPAAAPATFSPAARGVRHRAAPSPLLHRSRRIPGRRVA